MADREGRAAELYAKADKKFKKWSLFAASAEKKNEDAADLFTQAGNHYKLAQNYELAAKSFDKSAQCYVKLKCKHEAGNQYAAAALCYEKFSVPEAARVLQLAADLLADDGRHTLSAKHLVSLGDLYDKNQDAEKALEVFQKAAEIYRTESRPTQAAQCNVKAATNMATLEQYEAAHDLFEAVARIAVEDDMLKFSAKDYFLKAGLCYLACADVLGAKHGLDDWRCLDPTFSAQRECKFLQDIVDAYQAFDDAKFTKVVHEWEKVTRMNAWMTEMIVRIKLRVSRMETSLG
eukprot:TRINITY_DN8342_c0_g1_i1.p1 TRINITY_DN8342_c0_g1~~TRINITY_DN8342_c0_g1_i1.p1  ORF type:complete len:291 (+),score=91.53 TRINITY_DN8342_c0_g1_i1:177-1049(+)